MLNKNFIESIDLVWNYMQVHVFNVLSYSGEPCETEEMSPQWFSHDEIPFGMLVFSDCFMFWYTNTAHMICINIGQ